MRLYPPERDGVFVGRSVFPHLFALVVDVWPLHAGPGCVCERRSSASEGGGGVQAPGDREKPLARASRVRQEPLCQVQE